MIKKMKNYIVIIISKRKKQEVQVKARNKKEAKKMVSDVLTKCDLFGIKNLKDIKLKCKRTRRLV